MVYNLSRWLVVYLSLCGLGLRKGGREGEKEGGRAE